MSVAQIEASMRKGIAHDSLIHTCLTLNNVYHLAATHLPKQIETHEKALAFLRTQVVSDVAPKVAAL
jgi:hypothetical protein